MHFQTENREAESRLYLWKGENRHSLPYAVIALCNPGAGIYHKAHLGQLECRNDAPCGSKGDRQKRINEAQGKAEEILMISKATGDSIKKIGEAISAPGGMDAFNLKLKENYLGQLKHLADGSVEVIVPGTLNNYDQWIENIDLRK